MHLVKLKNGHFVPYDSTDHDESNKIKEGDVVKATRSRNYEFHKKAWALLGLGFDNQDKFESKNIYRKIITIRAGYCEMVIGKDGVTHPIPDSLSYENMSANKFEEWYKATLDVISDDLNTAPEVIQEQVGQFH